ncbi:TetR family transcriptional regulator C-terminal domain-containing protein [Lachnospiraceae bacterium ZAX-1]
MNDNVNDRRVRKTKKALREGLSILMIEKNIKDITVRELTDLVDLNRGTFYLHYKDVYELKQQIENDIISEITLIFNEYMPEKQGERPYPLFVTLLTYIQENATICRMLLSSNSGRTFLDKLSEFIEIQCLKRWLEHFRPQADSDELAYFSIFAVTGYIAIIGRWLESDMKTSLEELALMMERVGTYGIGFLDKAKS